MCLENPYLQARNRSQTCFFKIFASYTLPFCRLIRIMQNWESTAAVASEMEMLWRMSTKQSTKEHWGVAGNKLGRTKIQDVLGGSQQCSEQCKRQAPVMERMCPRVIGVHKAEKSSPSVRKHSGHHNWHQVPFSQVENQINLQFLSQILTTQHYITDFLLWVLLRTEWIRVLLAEKHCTWIA